jgi:hypothetical protein
MRTAQDILKSVGDILLDADYVHWTLPELCGWLNYGLDAITLQKPSASAVTVNVPLVRGPLQTLPANYVSILRPVRNVPGANADRNPRKRISVVSEQSLSQYNPSWDDEHSVPYTQQAKHFIFDEANPKAFYVYPGNDGTGVLEMVLCAVPAKIAPTGDANKLESYTAQLPLDETYHDALIDYVLYRAYSKDSQYAGAAQRAALHYQQFANSLGIKLSVEANTSPNTRTGVPQAASGVQQQG